MCSILDPVLLHRLPVPASMPTRRVEAMGKSSTWEKTGAHLNCTGKGQKRRCTPLRAADVEVVAESGEDQCRTRSPRRTGPPATVSRSGSAARTAPARLTDTGLRAALYNGSDTLYGNGGNDVLRGDNNPVGGGDGGDGGDDTDTGTTLEGSPTAPTSRTPLNCP
jgi:hypothetical protein